MQLSEDDFKKVVAPFYVLIGKDTINPEKAVLLDSRLCIIYEATRESTSEKISEALLRFGYDEELKRYNYFASETIEDAKVYINKLATYARPLVLESNKDLVLMKLRKMRIEKVLD